MVFLLLLLLLPADWVERGSAGLEGVAEEG